VKPFAFYQERLDRVSRSFALCIPQLAAPFREQVALAYLLLRVLDTVEDAPFIDKPEQAVQFGRFRDMLRSRPTDDQVAEFVANFPADISAGERSLVADTPALFEDAYELELPVRTAMFGAIDRMAEGMAAYTRRPNPLRMVDLEDVTRYCCFVAGLVGEMLTRLWAVSNREPAPSMALAYQFGIFLQKVNILKDQAEDEAVGRYFVPDRDELLASLPDHASGALRYLQAIPANDVGYRTFCAWSLMMGATTIAALAKPRVSRRDDTLRLLQRTAQIAADNAALADLLGELMPELPTAARRPPLPKPESPAWFRESLAAPLDEIELRYLGVA